MPHSSQEHRSVSLSLDACDCLRAEIYARLPLLQICFAGNLPPLSGWHCCAYILLTETVYVDLQGVICLQSSRHNLHLGQEIVRAPHSHVLLQVKDVLRPSKTFAAPHHMSVVLLQAQAHMSMRRKLRKAARKLRCKRKAPTRMKSNSQCKRSSGLQQRLPGRPLRLQGSSCRT